MEERTVDELSREANFNGLPKRLRRQVAVASLCNLLLSDIKKNDRTAATQPSARERGLDTLGRERHLSDARAGRVEDGVADSTRDHRDRGFARACCGHVGPVQKHHFDFWDRETQRKRVVGSPVN